MTSRTIRQLRKTEQEEPNFLDLERPADLAFWTELQSVVGELSSIGHALVATRRIIAVEGEEVVAVAFDIPNGELLIVVHRGMGEVSAMLPLAAGTRLIRHPSGEIEDDLTLTLGSFDVQVFLTTTCM